MNMSRLLTDTEVLDLLSSDSVINQAVQNVIETGYWPNGNPATEGWYVSDPNYGNLLIAENQGNGQIVYNTDLPPLNPSAVNMPPFNSGTVVTPPGPTVCPGWGNIGSINDFLACVGKTVTAAEWIFLGVAAWFIYKEMKS